MPVVALVNNFAIDGEFWLTLGLVGIPGILGGITYGLSLLLQAVKEKREDWPPCGNFSVGAYFGAQAIRGLGGAIAALLVILWANRFPPLLEGNKTVFENVQGWLTLACTGFIGGYVANRLLPAIAESLLRRLNQLEAKTDENAKKSEETAQKTELTAQLSQASATTAKVAKETAKDAVETAHEISNKVQILFDKAVQLSSVLVRAYDYLEKKAAWDQATTRLQVDTLTELASYFPTNRTLNILLGRLHAAALDDPDGAIRVLEFFVRAKSAAKDDADTDTADGYWNLANYYEDKFKATGEGSWREKEVDVLRKSIKIAPSYLADLRADDDFVDFRNSDYGREFRPSPDERVPSAEPIAQGSEQRGVMENVGDEMMTEPEAGSHDDKISPEVRAPDDPSAT